MSIDKAAKEVIIQHLDCLSRQYEELIILITESENPIQLETTLNPSKSRLLKKISKKSHR